MGSDGFESKQFGTQTGGADKTTPDAFARDTFARDTFARDGRGTAADSFAGLNDANKLVEVRGVIKWFDASKGYGFIVPED